MTTSGERRSSSHHRRRMKDFCFDAFSVVLAGACLGT
jgi:hypothetical protein